MLCGACMRRVSYSMLCGAYIRRELSMLCGAYMRQGSLACFVVHTCDGGA